MNVCVSGILMKSVWTEKYKQNMWLLEKDLEDKDLL